MGGGGMLAWAATSSRLEKCQRRGDSMLEPWQRTRFKQQRQAKGVYGGAAPDVVNDLSCYLMVVVRLAKERAMAGS